MAGQENKRQGRWRIVPVMLLLILAGCATTTLKGSWVNPDYQGNRVGKMLVLGISENETYRRMFENSLSMKLSSRGVEAEPGYTLFAEEKRPSRAAIAAEIAARGFDAMIISKVTGRRTKEVVHPGQTYYMRDPLSAWPFYGRRHGYPTYYGHHWYDYYSRSYTVVHEPGYVAEYKIVTVESNIYDAQSDELIWSGITETVVDGNMEKLINSLADTLINELVEKKLI